MGCRAIIVDDNAGIASVLHSTLHLPFERLASLRN
jgi:hypothetical protein